MVRIGIIGLGIGMFHIGRINEAENGEVYAICDLNKEKLKTVGDRLGIPEERRFTNYLDLINCEGVDAVEVCTPNYLHAKMAIDVIKAGKPVQVEKPLDVNFDEAVKIRNALEENYVPNMTTLSYRYYSCVRYAKHLLEQNAIGEIVSLKIEYLKDSAFWKGRRLDWRFEKKYAGEGGVTADLGAHLFDLSEFLVGRIDRIMATTNIIVKKRQVIGGDEWADVETDDVAQGLFKHVNGATALFNISRCAQGHSNHILVDIYGKDGMISADLNEPDKIKLCIGEEAIAKKQAIEVDVPAEFKMSQEEAFILAVEGTPDKYHPSIDDGLRCQRIIDSILESSKKNTWIKV